MRTTGRFAVLFAAVLLPEIALRAHAPSIIEPKPERLQGPPRWISAEVVADEEKTINLDLLDHRLRSGALLEPRADGKYSFSRRTPEPQLRIL